MEHCRLAITDAQADLPWHSAHGADLRAMLVDHEPVEEECIADERDGASVRFLRNGYQSFSRALTPAKSCEARR
jgi:hypothetical protein